MNPMQYSQCLAVLLLLFASAFATPKGTLRLRRDLVEHIRSRIFLFWPARKMQRRI